MYHVECLEGRTLFASYAAASAKELIAAMTQANSSAEADTIALAAGTAFSLTAAADNNATNGATGLPVVAAGGGALTIVGGARSSSGVIGSHSSPESRPRSCMAPLIGIGFVATPSRSRHRSRSAR